MCGLAGVMSSTLSNAEVSAFQNLMLFATTRGFQGAGITAISKKNSNTIRYNGTAAELAYSDRFEKIMKERPSVLIGHARWPTRGEVSIKNTHPHRADHIIGMHNGTIYRVNGKGVAQDASDSATLFQSFAENGVSTTIENTNGAMALVWLDTKLNTLNFYRNTERPLVFAQVGWNDRCSTLYWASEPWMLRVALERSGVKDVKTQVLPAYQWLVYPRKPDHNIRAIDQTDFTPETKPVEVHNGYVPRPYVPPFREASNDGVPEYLRRSHPTGRPPLLNSQGRPIVHHGVHRDETDKTLAIGGDQERFMSRGDTPTSVPAVGSFPTGGDRVDDLFRKTKRFLDRGCAWCNEVVESIETEVYPVYGSSEYICQGCGEIKEVHDNCLDRKVLVKARLLFASNS